MKLFPDSIALSLESRNYDGLAVVTMTIIGITGDFIALRNNAVYDDKQTNFLTVYLTIKVYLELCMIGDIKQDATLRMGKCIEALLHEMGKVRTGRAHPGLLDQVMVNYYGSDVPIRQVANISVEDGRTLVVTPWERSVVAAVEKAIINSGLGLNPNTAGNVIRVPMPPLTEERRRDLIKVVRHEAEQARVAIRAVRRDANHSLKELVKEKIISEDDERRGGETVQKLTDNYIKEVDTVLQEKEKDLLSI